MPVAVDEMAGSPWIESTGGRTTLHRQVKIAWTDVDDYAEELIPGGIVVGNTIQNVGGQPFPGRPQFRVTGFKMIPFHENEIGANGVNAYGLPLHEFALVDISYNVIQGVGGGLPQNQDYDPVDLLVHSMDGGGEIVTIPHFGLKYRRSQTAGDSTYRDVPGDLWLSIFVPLTQHETHWSMVPSPNWLALESLKGSVNTAPFILRGFPYAPENVLYLGYTARQSTKSIQVTEPLWEIGLRFSIRTVPAADYLTFGSVYGGHNHRFINDPPNAFGFYKYTTGPEATPPLTPPYRLTDFSQLYTAIISASL